MHSSQHKQTSGQKFRLMTYDLEGKSIQILSPPSLQLRPLVITPMHSVLTSATKERTWQGCKARWPGLPNNGQCNLEFVEALRLYLASPRRAMDEGQRLAGCSNNCLGLAVIQLVGAELVDGLSARQNRCLCCVSCLLSPRVCMAATQC